MLEGGELVAEGGIGWKSERKKENKSEWRGEGMRRECNRERIAAAKIS